MNLSKNTVKKIRVYAFFLLIGLLVVVGSYRMNRHAVETEENDNTSSLLPPAKVRPQKRHVKAKIVPPESRYPETAFDFEPYKGILTIEQDTSTNEWRSGRATVLDGMSHDEIAAYRLEKVQEYRELNFFPPGYHPFKSYHRQIYGPITPGEGWLPPTTYYVGNPYVLIVMTCANHVTALNSYCPGVTITYENGVIRETHKEEDADCWFHFVYGSNDYPGQVRPQMINAWDAGFFYIHVDTAQSLNIKKSHRPDNVTNCAATVKSFYHVGKYGVNNISPERKNHWLSLEEQDTETIIYVKLWRKRPESPGQSPDMVYIVHVMPQ